MRRSVISIAGVAALTVPAFLGLTGTASAAPGQAFHETITFDPAAGEDAPGQIEASGAVSGSGLNYSTSGRDTGRTSHSTELQVFDDGTISVKDSGPNNDVFDPATCTDTNTQKGQFTVTGGTGAYAGIKGHGHFTVNAQVTFAQNTDGSCNFDEPPTGQVIVNVDGTVKF